MAILDFRGVKGLKIFQDGDSITAGTGANLPINVNGWAPKLAVALGMQLINNGKSSKTLQSVPSQYLQYGFNAFDINESPTWNPSYGLYILSLGVNDAALNNTKYYNYINFRSILINAVNALIAKGWPRNRILLCAPTWLNQAGLNSYSFATGVTINTLDGVQLYRDSVLQAAINTDVLYVDLSKPIEFVVNKDIYLPDNVHPNQSYHDMIVDYIVHTIIANQANLIYTYIAEDDFSSLDITDITGRLTPIGSYVWQKASGSGTLGIVSNKLKLTSINTTGATYIFDTNVRNGAKVAVVGAIPLVAFNSGFFPLYIDTDNYILITTAYDIIVRTSGSSVTVWDSGLPAISWVTGDVITVILTSTTIQLIRNGVSLITVVGGGGLISTKIGFEITQDTQASFDLIRHTII